MKFKNHLFKYWREITLFFVALLFFFSSGAFNFSTQDYAQSPEEIDFVKWLSPDETSNYIFSKLYAQTGEMVIYEKYNLLTKDIMRPRSFRSDFGDLKPVSFLGIILIYGKIASVFGYKVIPFLTPLFAALGILFFYFLIKRLFNRNIGFISAILLAVFPVYGYYSARSMFHNVLITVMLIVGAYFGLRMLDEKKESMKNDWFGMLFASLSGFFIGLGIITRASELLWIAPCLLLIWLFNVRKIGFIKFALFLSFLFLALLPNLYYNQILYNSPVAGGYNEMNESIRNIKEAGKGIVQNAIESGESEKHRAQIETIRDSVFHFGIHPNQSLRMFYQYFVKMFPYIFWPASLGFLLFFAVNILSTKKRHWIYLLSFMLVSFVLVLYYGSWQFNDNPDPNAYTIGNSYTRYWLPIYLASFPMAAYAILYISKFFVRFKNFFVFEEESENTERKSFREIFFSWNLRDSFVRRSIEFSFFGVIMFFSLHYVLAGSEEGLFFTVNNQKDVRAEWHRIIELTPHNSTLITRYHDKLFFPERKVIMGEFNDKNMVALYADLATHLPLYYYNFTLPDASIKWLNGSRLGEVGLNIEKVERITKDFTLYRLYIAE